MRNRIVTWNGGIELAIVPNPANPLDDDDYPGKKVDFELGQWMIYTLFLMIVILILLILISSMLKRKRKE